MTPLCDLTRPKDLLSSSDGKMHRVFFAICLFFGLLLVFVTPAFQIPDEPSHFYRAYQISDGGLIGEKREEGSGGVIPQSLPKTVEHILRKRLPILPDVLETLSYPLDRTKTDFVRFENSTSYSPIPYIPQAIGISFGKLFNACPVVLLFLGRISNLLFAAFVCKCAIRIAPILKEGFALLALMPMSMYLFASVSPDAGVISLCFLFIAIVLRAITNPEDSFGGGLIGLAILLGLAKTAYAPLICCSLLAFNPRNPKRRQVLAVSFGAILAGFVADMLWAKTATTIYSPLLPGLITIQDASHFIHNHPVSYGRMMLSNLTEHWWIYLRGFVGILGWMNLEFKTPFILSYIAALVVSANLANETSISLGLKKRLFVGGIAASVVALILTGLFFAWTQAGSLGIGMAQGRYFIPIAPLVLLLCYNAFPLRVPSRCVAFLLPCYSLISLTYMVALVFRRYY